MLININIFKLYGSELISFDNINLMKKYIEIFLHNYCNNLEDIIYSDNVETIDNLII